MRGCLPAVTERFVRFHRCTPQVLEVKDASELGLTFVYPGKDLVGDNIDVKLRPAGESEAVTNDNREAYVRACVAQFAFSGCLKQARARYCAPHPPPSSSHPASDLCLASRCCAAVLALPPDSQIHAQTRTRRATARNQSQVHALCRGFREIVPSALVAHLTPEDLDLLLCGANTLDVRDMRAHTAYRPYSADEMAAAVTEAGLAAAAAADPRVAAWARSVGFFWEVVGAFAAEEGQPRLRELLQFMTGSPQVRWRSRFSPLQPFGRGCLDGAAPAAAAQCRVSALSSCPRLLLCTHHPPTPRYLRVDSGSSKTRSSSPGSPAGAPPACPRRTRASTRSTCRRTRARRSWLRRWGWRWRGRSGAAEEQLGSRWRDCRRRGTTAPPPAAADQHANERAARARRHSFGALARRRAAAWPPPGSRKVSPPAVGSLLAGGDGAQMPLCILRRRAPAARAAPLMRSAAAGGTAAAAVAGGAEEEEGARLLRIRCWLERQRPARPREAKMIRGVGAVITAFFALLLCTSRAASVLRQAPAAAARARAAACQHSQTCGSSTTSTKNATHTSSTARRWLLFEGALLPSCCWRVRRRMMRR